MQRAARSTAVDGCPGEAVGGRRRRHRRSRRPAGSRAWSGRGRSRGSRIHGRRGSRADTGGGLRSRVADDPVRRDRVAGGPVARTRVRRTRVFRQQAIRRCASRTRAVRERVTVHGQPGAHGRAGSRAPVGTRAPPGTRAGGGPGPADPDGRRYRSGCRGSGRQARPVPAGMGTGAPNSVPPGPVRTAAPAAGSHGRRCLPAWRRCSRNRRMSLRCIPGRCMPGRGHRRERHPGRVGGFRRGCR